MKASECHKWLKKFGPLHLSKAGEWETICGKPMLGNNYARYTEDFGEKCPKCFAEVEDDI